MMNLLDRMGDFNPQFLRELKGRLNWRSVLVVIGLSIVVQALLFLWFYRQLPTEVNYQYSSYCAYLFKGEIIPKCHEYDREILYKSTFTNWSLWWRHLEKTLDLGIPFLLMIPGACLVASNLQNEERQGTLNFLRLSPRSGSNILLGKLLGVPILLYAAIASIVPFHLFVTLKAGNSLIFLVSFYLMLAAGAYLLFSFTLLVGFLSKSILKPTPALGVTLAYVLVTIIFVPTYLMWNTATVWKPLSIHPVWKYGIISANDTWFWYGLPISQNAAIAHLFTLVNIAILSGWIWQGLTRCFDRPNATILRKRQSYAFIFYLQVLILGLGVVNETNRSANDWATYPGMILLPLVLNLPIFLTLIAILTPQRQAVMDWARYRHRQSPRSSLLKDLLFHDQSPAGLAIAVNLAIAGVVWLVAFAFRHQWAARQERNLVLMVGMSLSVIALYASIVQWVVIQKTRKRNSIAAAVLGMAILIPPTFVSLLPFRGLIWTTLRESVILTSPFLWTLANGSFSISLSFWSALLGQLSLIAGINALTVRQIRRIGASELSQLKEAQ